MMPLQFIMSAETNVLDRSARFEQRPGEHVFFWLHGLLEETTCGQPGSLGGNKTVSFIHWNRKILHHMEPEFLASA